MDATFRGLLVYKLAPRSQTATSVDTQSFSLPPPSSTSRYETLIPSVIAHNSSTHTRRSGSTVWGPGALTGKLLKQMGQGLERSAEYWVIRTYLSKLEKTQLDLLRSTTTPTEDEQLVQIECRKLVDLCIIGMHYPSRLVKWAFILILRGFKLPGRKTWTRCIAEAISEHDIMDVFEIFQETFFVLLDDSIFRIDGIVDLGTLRFRCPVVAREIASIISHLARKDCCAGPLSSASLSLTLALCNTAVTEDASRLRPAFSRAIIEAGFFRLSKYWAERGLPHWDQRGVEALERALKDIADAQEHHGDSETAGEAKELMRKLQSRRLLLDDVGEEPESYGLIEEIE